MTQVNAAIVSEHSVTLVINGQTTPITDSHPNYDEIRQLASAGTYAGIPALLDLVTSIVEFGAGAITVENGMVLYKGVETHNTVTSRILQMVDEGLSVGPLVNFLENLVLNPSFRAVSQLYGFLEVNDLPITEDGYFLAYKMVRDDFTDHRTGKFDYSVGAPAAEMPRNMVNENPDETCSAGLHVCAQGYLGFYGSGQGNKVILVKVNPADVVAVPNDYDNAKMRVCRHETVREIDPDTKGFAFTSAVYNEDAMDNGTLASDGELLTHDEALAYFDCNASALRKRLNRKVSAKRAYVDGVEMIQVIDTEVDDAPETDSDLVTPDEAMNILGINKDALRKRLARGVTIVREWIGNTPMVRFLNKD